MSDHPIATVNYHFAVDANPAPAPALPRPLDLSVIIPFFKATTTVAPLLAELRTILADPSLRPDDTGRPLSAEIICIDDGSRDTTSAELLAAARTWSALRVVTFATPRGQAAALWHGLRIARGTYLAVLDGAGQSPPSALARLWPLRDTADLLSGARENHQPSALSRIVYTVRRAALRDGVTDADCALKLFRRDVVAAFLPIRTLSSFLPAFAVAAGFTVREVPVAHRLRLPGTSQPGLGATFFLPLLDLLALSWVLRRTLYRKASSPDPRP